MVPDVVGKEVLFFTDVRLDVRQEDDVVKFEGYDFPRICGVRCASNDVESAAAREEVRVVEHLNQWNVSYPRTRSSYLLQWSAGMLP